MHAHRLNAVLLGALLAACGGSFRSPHRPASGPLLNDVTSDVLQHHKNGTKNGVYVDPLITQAAAANTVRDTTFEVVLDGQVYAQPLFVQNGPDGQSILITVTENNQVLAINAADGSVIWENLLEPPALRTQYGCGNITPNIGVTGTPAIDLDARMLFVAADTTDGFAPHHKLFALSIDDGSVVLGWPVDFSGVDFGGAVFNSQVHNQRGGLLLDEFYVYVPYGGHFGDCNNYKGWVIAVPKFYPQYPSAFWTTAPRGGGIWAPAGLSTDGTDIFASTGNTFNTLGEWQRGEAVVRLGPGATFDGSDTANYFAPSNWLSLDGSDADLGGTAPIPVDVDGAIPSQLIVIIGKTGFAYLLDRANLGGIGGEQALSQVSGATVINAPATFTAFSGTYVVAASTGSGIGCPVGSGNLVAFQIGASSPPSINMAWCASVPGRAGPIVTTTDGISEPVVWTIATGATSRLRAYNAETGELIFNGDGPDDGMGSVRPFQTPIVANGRIYVVSDRPSVTGQSQLYAFTPQ